ncbi:U2 snRNP-associated SURP motif-containing protein isoform X2 [Cylas formicarius]|uniref:U2 snRNP-associated SURP motif-containing protein isoform X2 n=1 Tax=Cylas formicarius TaxID=197179 RepID=UPI002958D6CE|nr:U2 snRNP-associated SURP motif-containing protein isoform X2 [Cylas formicarius]
MSDKVKNIPEQKLKAFSIGTMGKRTLSKRELEEQRKREEEKAAAHVFQEFVETFQEAPINGSSKVWVKAGTYDAGARKEDTKDKGKLYKPTSRIQPPQESLSTAERAQAYAKLLSSDKKPERLGKKKQSSKSNLEAFMEELKQIQEEREERHKYKGQIARTPIEAELDLFMRGDVGSFDNGDPNTTNLYLGNLNPKISEPQLMEIFGRYGPLASIKIMWPRSDEEKARGRNCGFVAYMSRKDGERALKSLNGKDIGGYEMKLGWGKAVIIPPQPIYIPSVLLELGHPPPPSGLPFNAQPAIQDRDVLPKSDEELNAILLNAVVKVVIPNDKNLLMLIHRMVEFVVREGPMFEAMIMNRELHNPQFRFLFENQSPSHIYYRWKVYSILHGDSQKEWKTKEFRMFEGGSIWKPPILACYTNGMPDELVADDNARDPCKGTLSNSQRDRLEDLIRNLTPEKKKVGEAMVYCIDHSEAADEIVECITESLSNESTIITKKIARLYLVSDILHNCGVKVNKASNYRKVFQEKLVDIMVEIKKIFDGLESRLQAEGFKVRVLRILKSWEDVGIYTSDFMNKLHNTFLGLEEKIKTPEREEDIDGNPLDKTSEDEMPMDGAALLKSVMQQYSSSPELDEDIDGEEIKEDALTTKNSASSGFIKSKWEAVDPEQIEAQAMTTSKWDLLESSQETSQDSNSNLNDNQDSSLDYNDTRNMTEEKRMKLREIEVKAVQYQDELESGQRSLKSGWTVTQQVEHYRRKLLRKSEKESKKDKGEKTPKGEKHKRDYEKSETRTDETSDDEYYKDHTSRKSKKHARSSSSGSTSRHRSKSRSPTRKRRVSPPTPPRSRRHSPSSSSSRSRKRKDSNSPSSSSATRYSSPHSTSRHSRYSPSPSPNRSKHSRRSTSPKRRSRSTSRTRYYSPDSTSSSSRKHRHKHKY